MAMFSSRRHHAIERRHFVIQKPVIVRLDHFAVQHFLELLQIEHHAGDRIGIAFERDFDHVVVAVAVRIGGGAEQLLGSRGRSAAGFRQTCDAENSTRLVISI